MEALIHLDTHVVVWVYIGDRERLRPVWKTLRQADLVISPIVLLELQYLFEIGRVAEPAETVWLDLVERVGLRTSDAPFSQVIHQSLAQSWTRDPFDRLIAANALVEDRPLLTFDASIRKHCKLAFWK
jgi:PIN domain nuclease of toxin-antitoxin system